MFDNEWYIEALLGTSIDGSAQKVIIGGGGIHHFAFDIFALKISYQVVMHQYFMYHKGWMQRGQSQQWQQM